MYKLQRVQAGTAFLAYALVVELPEFGGVLHRLLNVAVSHEICRWGKVGLLLFVS